MEERDLRRPVQGHRGAGGGVQSLRPRTRRPSGLPAAAKGNLEGYLFPSTYEFPAKSTAAQQLKTMVAKTVAELEKAGVAEADYWSAR